MTIRKALVTGALRGIGKATAERLRRDGFDVTTLDVHPGCDLVLDIATSPLDPEIFGQFDVIVANAAIVNIIAPSEDFPLEQWKRDIDVNLTGAWRTIQACLKGMRERRYGRIVVISSGAATGGLPNQVAYSASKAGLLGMVRTLAVEHARHGIAINAVLPGGIKTEAFDGVPQEVLDGITKHVPAGRFGTPEEAAHLIAFFASELAGYVTGEQIGINGALGLHNFTQAHE